MLKITTFRIALALTISMAANAVAHAQPITGSWIKTDEQVTHKNGKIASTFKMLVKSMPCFAEIIYRFSSGGKMSEQSLNGSHWKISGNQLTIDAADDGSPVKHAKYQITFVGDDEMIWVFHYSENPGAPNMTGVTEMRSTYKRRGD